ncbi:MAG TPA: nucleoside triphosphate pyrophosphohydrolase [Gemmatimonadales bacterium]
MQASSAVGRVVDLVRDLRARCPWDAAQTPQTLRPYLMEEVFELDHALGEDDADAIRVELGDLLLHLAFQVVLAEERAQFGPEDLTRQVEEKMWRRHPHLFPAPHGTYAPTAESVKANWEKLKLRERGGEDRPGVLDGLPPGMPALIMALRLQERAAGIGFDWPDAAGPLAKIREETEELVTELDQTRNRERIAQEIGDLLFAVVNFARKVDVDPRAALDGANRKFRRRFRAVEALAAERGIDVHTAGLDALDRLWDEVKAAQG